jgi:hypothetical protein
VLDFVKLNAVVGVQAKVQIMQHGCVVGYLVEVSHEGALPTAIRRTVESFGTQYGSLSTGTVLCQLARFSVNWHGWQYRQVGVSEHPQAQEQQFDGVFGNPALR